MFFFERVTKHSLQIKFWQYLQTNLLHTTSKISPKQKFPGERKCAEKMFRLKVIILKLNFYQSNVMDDLLLSYFLTLLIINTRLIALVLLQFFYPSKYIQKEIGRLLFQKYPTLIFHKMLVRENLLS